MTAGSPSPEQEDLARLHEENTQLKIEIERLRTRDKLEATLYRRLGSLAYKIVVGRSVAAALRSWLQRILQEHRVPINETSELAAAVVHRFVRVGLFAFVAALLPVIVLGIQTVLLHQQNEIIRQQNTYFQQQIDGIQDQLALERRDVIRQVYDREIMRARRRLAAEVAAGLNGTLTELQDDRRFIIRTRDREVVITNEGDKQRITASTDLLFATVSTKLSSEGMAFLTTLTTAIQRQKELIRRVEVQGHTDATPINPNSYDGPFNLELAGLRAARVVRFMQAAGLDPADTEMVATSFGEYRPLAPDGSHRGRAVNRRVEILLTVAGPHLYQQMYEELFGAAVINANSE